jgi:uncharacterized protein
MVLALGIAVYLFTQANWLQVTTHQVYQQKTVEGLEGFRILQLSDLHSKNFGKENSRLIGRIHSSDPDIIVMSGDMINATDDDGTVVVNLIENLKGRYPIFYSLGNHEQLAKQYAKETGSDKYEKYMQNLKENNVVVLDNAKAEIPFGLAQINLYGFTLPLEYYTGDKVENFLFETKLEEGLLVEILDEPDPETLNILLAHAPKYFKNYTAWGADLILSGHAHGGLIRVPGIGGLLAPQQGFLPEYDGGKYTQNGKTMIVNRGKGNHILNLRVNNRPEITVVDVVYNQ